METPRLGTVSSNVAHMKRIVRTETNDHGLHGKFLRADFLLALHDLGRGEGGYRGMTRPKHGLAGSHSP